MEKKIPAMTKYLAGIMIAGKYTWKFIIYFNNKKASEKRLS